MARHCPQAGTRSGFAAPCTHAMTVVQPVPPPTHQAGCLAMASIFLAKAGDTWPTNPGSISTAAQRCSSTAWQGGKRGFGRVDRQPTCCCSGCTRPHLKPSITPPPHCVLHGRAAPQASSASSCQPTCAGPCSAARWHSITAEVRIGTTCLGKASMPSCKEQEHQRKDAAQDIVARCSMPAG